MHVVKIWAALAVVASLLHGPGAAEAAEPGRHVVKAGSAIPGGGSEPFTFTAFYPNRLQVHRGDVVSWAFTGGYGGWHSVTFSDPGGSPQPAWRTDEHPGHLALNEPWLFGQEQGDEAAQCGRGAWHHLPAQAPCVLDEEALAGHFSSSVWDRFFSTAYPGSFEVVVDLPAGRYPYYCRLHPARVEPDGTRRGMGGVLEVVADEESLSNPSPDEIEAEIASDYEAAKELFAQLNDPERAWDGDEWVVQVGAETSDGDVEIYQFLPASLPAVKPGDRVRFEAGTSEPNSVSFPADNQGGFNLGGDCDSDSCQGNPPGSPVGVPWGLTGLAFPWGCEYDEPDGGAPGILMSYTAPRLHARTAPMGVNHGCRSAEGATGRPEMLVAPWMASGTPAPGGAVASRATVHMSGAMMDGFIPDWWAGDPRGGRFPDTFRASFPVAGSFTYACLNHEFMRGSVTVG